MLDHEYLSDCASSMTNPRRRIICIRWIEEYEIPRTRVQHGPGIPESHIDIDPQFPCGTLDLRCDLPVPLTDHDRPGSPRRGLECHQS